MSTAYKRRLRLQTSVELRKCWTDYRIWLYVAPISGFIIGAAYRIPIQGLRSVLNWKGTLASGVVGAIGSLAASVAGTFLIASRHAAEEIYNEQQKLIPPKPLSSQLRIVELAIKNAGPTAAEVLRHLRDVGQIVIGSDLKPNLPVGMEYQSVREVLESLRTDSVVYDEPTVMQAHSGPKGQIDALLGLERTRYKWRIIPEMVPAVGQILDLNASLASGPTS